MRKPLRSCLVAVLVAGLAIDNATAGWLCRQAARCCTPCPPPSCCEPVYCAPVSCAPAPCETSWSEPACCGSTTVVTPADADAPSATFEPSDGWSSADAELPPAPDAPAPTPAEPPVAPGDEVVVEPAPLTAPAPRDEPDAPAEMMPVEPAAEESLDDLFSEEPAAEETPAEEPGEGSLDDLFGEEPATEEMPGEEPAEESLDDLFGDQPATEEMPADESADEPVDQVFSDQPAVDEPLDNLFEDLPADEPVEAAEPEGDASLDDLFGQPTEGAAPAEDAPAAGADGDMFGGEPVDDMFSEEPSGEESGPAADEAGGESDMDDFGDLFPPLSHVLRTPGGFASVEMRTWADNTGLYRTRGRLLSVHDGAVKLLKANGRTATVPMSRLSIADMRFVERQAAAEQAQDVTRTAQR